MANRHFAITHILPKLPEFMRLNPNLRVCISIRQKVFPTWKKRGLIFYLAYRWRDLDELVRRRVVATPDMYFAPHLLFQKIWRTENASADLIKHRLYYS